MAEIKIIRTPINGIAGKLATYSSVFIVYDNNVKDFAYSLGIKAKSMMGIEVSEENKTIETVQAICRWLMEEGADRKAFVLAVGGGITTDLTGFAASVYKRGVRFGFLPTTLLAQVDASIGGKNGVNLDSYKNMIGVFRQPEMTFICPEALETLPYNELLSGAAELLKTFIIDDSGRYYEKAVRNLQAIRESVNKGETIQKKFPEILEEIAAAADIKAGIASRDPLEHGERRLLNLGHTFAHAIEKKSSEKISHGEAVAMGIILAARLSESLGLAENGLARKLKTDFEACGLPAKCPYKIENLAEAMKKDKKAEGEIVHFVLPVSIGKVVTRDLEVEDVVNRLK